MCLIIWRKNGIKAYVDTMVLSRNKLFRIRDKHEKEFPFIVAPTKVIYICAEPGTPFTISLEKAKHDHKVYAPKLYIDGQEVYGFKTFPKICNYHGFKMGRGVYKEFVFNDPPLAGTEEDKENLFNHKGDFGKIKVVLYDCISMPSSFGHREKAPYSILVANSSSTPPAGEDRRQEGRVFCIEDRTDQSFIYRKSKKGDYSSRHQYAGCFNDDPLDFCEIRYSTFISLQILGVLHVSNIKHMKVLFALVEDAGEVPLDKLAALFYTWVRRDIEVCYNLHNTLGEVNLELFKKHPEYFELVEGECPKLRAVKREKSLASCPVPLPQEYFLVNAATIDDDF